jgi:hypothetical protein
MTPRTPQCEVFWALLSNSKHSGVPEDFKSPTLEVLGFTPTLGQSGVATIYDYPPKDAIQTMFREKAIMATPKEDNVVVNMVLAITTYSQIPENVVFKEKEPFKNKRLVISKKRKSFNIHLKKLLKTYKKRSCMEPN